MPQASSATRSVMVPELLCKAVRPIFPRNTEPERVGGVCRVALKEQPSVPRPCDSPHMDLLLFLFMDLEGQVNEYKRLAQPGDVLHERAPEGLKGFVQKSRNRQSLV